MIEASGIQVRAGRAILLDEVSIQVQPGRVTAVLGPNGAGKSTLLEVLSGGRKPDKGHVGIAGRAMAGCSAPELARMRAVLRQSSQLGFAFSVAEVVALGRQPFAGTPAMLHDATAIQDAARQLDLLPLWHRAFPGLSGGEQQRVHLARVLAQLWRPDGDAAPRYLLLDEPTSAMDLKHRQIALFLAREMARHGAGVLAVLHDLNLAAAFADDVVLLCQGQVQHSGQVTEVLNASALEACFGVPFEALTRADGSKVFVTAGSDGRCAPAALHRQSSRSSL